MKSRVPILTLNLSYLLQEEATGCSGCGKVWTLAPLPEEPEIRPTPPVEFRWGKNNEMSASSDNQGSIFEPFP